MNATLEEIMNECYPIVEFEKEADNERVLKYKCRVIIEKRIQIESFNPCWITRLSDQRKK